MTSSPSTSLRDVARNAVRDEVMRAAWELFAVHGFEATTVEQIAEAAGMSRRTFFRYFNGKDELILDKLLEVGDRVAAALAARPPKEAAWPALRAALDVVVLAQDQAPEPSRRLGQLLRDEPSTRGSMEERRRRWTDALGPLVAERLPGHGEAAGRAVAGAALACYDAATDAWIDAPGTAFARHLDTAMDALAHAALA
ncbi:MAG TPA: TetR family transcriptional regulator [Nocardioides sp.]|uniref:TetR family transcriptional regulator n=1 Tax=Nocardioides sp. TaxID=35761 RepID=UPI002E31339C|nr:TetR family transcriptional regulator [Nocardioides sp.]HEX3932650.1 TetR family transcriptional regulator [Nocardioides sp.]